MIDSLLDVGKDMDKVIFFLEKENQMNQLWFLHNYEKKPYNPAFYSYKISTRYEWK